jgi:hypothetical protein
LCQLISRRNEAPKARTLFSSFLSGRPNEFRLPAKIEGLLRAWPGNENVSRFPESEMRISTGYTIDGLLRALMPFKITLPLVLALDGSIGSPTIFYENFVKSAKGIEGGGGLFGPPPSPPPPPVRFR